MTVVTLPDSQTIQTAYSGGAAGVGASVTATDQVGRKRKSEVDGLGRVVKVTEQNPATGALDPTNYLTTYTYDVLDNLKQVNQGGQLRTYQYDALSRLTSETTPEGGTITYTYTSFNALNTRSDPRGVVTTYGYDGLNRLNTVSYNTSSAPGVLATPGTTITYRTTSPGKGQINSVSGAVGNESFVYDSLARVSSKTRLIDSRTYTTSYTYNTANQLTIMTYPSGKRVRVNRDTRGRTSGIDKVDSGGNFLSSYASGVGYNVAGQVTGVTLGNGVVESYGYSADRLQMTSQSAVKGAATLMSLTYGFAATAGASGTSTTAGNSGQLMSISGTVNNQSRAQAFTYDNLGRLKTASGWSVWNQTYGYDRWGNKTSVTGTSAQTVVIQTNAGIPTNRISTVNGVGYTHDGAGNVTNDGVRTYQYDAESRLRQVNSGTTADNAYDAANRRVKKVAGGVTTHYVWEGSQVIAEYTGSTGALIWEYIYAGGRMIARDQGGVMRYYLQDRLSTRVISDGNGAVVGTEDHLPFGDDPLTGTGEAEKHRFTTYERDSESGSDYAVNRQYSYSTGRFLRPDPIQGTTGNPQRFNRYTYTINDPINLIDPLGLDIKIRTCYNEKMEEVPCNSPGAIPGGDDVIFFGWNPDVPDWSRWSKGIFIDGWGIFSTITQAVITEVKTISNYSARKGRSNRMSCKDTLEHR